MALTPDYKGAFIAWARAQGAITALVPSARISGNLPTADNMPQSYLTAVKTGGYGSAVYLPIDQPRLDIWCYGATEYEAMRLWRTVQGLLIPPGRAQSGIVGFEAAKTRVLDVQNEASAREAVTPEGWPFVWAPYIFTISEIMLP